MNMLRDKSANIQFEAFHVFKVFVANPKKPADVADILLKNKEKLIAYLENFHNDKDDEQFNEEKALLIKTLHDLQPTPAPAPAASAPAAPASAGASAGAEPPAAPQSQ